MFKEDDIYLTTGEFAKLCNTSKDTLFHYDKIGLLSPQYKNEKNYRFYSLSQLQEFYSISILKELGISLTHLKLYLSDKDSNEYIKLLTFQKDALDNRIHHLLAIRHTIDNKIHNFNKSINASVDFFSVEDISEEFILESHTIKFTNATHLTKEIVTLYKACASKGLSPSYEIGYIKDIAELEKDLPRQYFKLFLKVLNNTTNITALKKPSGKYLVCYHKGRYSTVKDTCKKLLYYITENNITVKGPIYEHPIIDETSSTNIDEYLYRLEVFIE